MDIGWEITDDSETRELASRFPKLFLAISSDQKLYPVQVGPHG